MKIKTSINIFLVFILCVSSLSYAGKAAEGKRFMVVSSEKLVTKIGEDILIRGGNAMDAAVAMGYALAVTEPCCGNLGGGGFLSLRLANGEMTFLNFREKAPAKISTAHFLDEKESVQRHLLHSGYLTVGVPGTVKGLNALLKKYGTMPLNSVMAPAIKLAEQGFPVSATMARNLKSLEKQLAKQSNVKKIFFKDARPYQAGEILKQPDLANTLKLIAEKGSRAFYEGAIAHKIAHASQEHGGVLSVEDFKNYTVKFENPVHCNYRGYDVYSAPPPSSGGATLCEMLKILKDYPVARGGRSNAMNTHYTLEAMRYAYADRNQYLGDPAFVKNPVRWLLSDNHIADIRGKISKTRASDSKKVCPAAVNKEKPQTTHFSVVDQFGNAASMTVTLNGYYGAKVIAGDTGFFLNNELDDFTIKVGAQNAFQLMQGERNLLAPNKQPLSSMSPTIITKDKQLFMVLGTPGGSTIITTVLQVIQNVIDYGMDLQTAVDAPRFHMQCAPDKVFTEPGVFSKKLSVKLTSMGYTLDPTSVYYTRRWGAVAAILSQPSLGKLYGVMDNRRADGLASGQ